jgi:hypothetical protein
MEALQISFDGRVLRRERRRVRRALRLERRLTPPGRRLTRLESGLTRTRFALSAVEVVLSPRTLGRPRRRRRLGYTRRCHGGRRLGRRRLGHCGALGRARLSSRGIRLARLDSR